MRKVIVNSYMSIGEHGLHCAPACAYPSWHPYRHVERILTVVTHLFRGRGSSCTPVHLYPSCHPYRHMIQPYSAANLNFRQYVNLAYSPNFPFTEYSGYTV